MSKEKQPPIHPQDDVEQRMLAMEIAKAACTLIAAGETDHKKAVGVATSTYLEALFHLQAISEDNPIKREVYFGNVLG